MLLVSQIFYSTYLRPSKKSYPQGTCDYYIFISARYDDDDDLVFYVFSTIFKSYKNDGMLMKGSVL